MGKGGGGGGGAYPDYNVGLAAREQAQTGRETLDFMRNAYQQGLQRQDVTDALSRQVTQQQLAAGQQQMDTMAEQLAWARQDRARTTGVFQPLEDEYIAQAREWDSPERQARLAQEARADVMGNAAMAKQATNRSLAAMGVNPASGRYVGTNAAGDLATGLAAAGAANNARSLARNQGLAVRESAINLGRGLGASAANSVSMGIGAGQAATGAGSAAMGTNAMANQNFYNNNQQMMQGYSGLQQGLAASNQSYLGLYNAQQNAYAQQQNASANSAAGIGSTIGAVAGIAAMFM